MLQWIETKIKTGGLFNQVATALGFATALLAIYQATGTDKEALIWSLTVTFFICIFFMLLNYCTYTQGVLRDEVARCANAKSKLETQILKKRGSSKGKQ